MKEVEVIKARNDLQTRTRGKTIELMRVGHIAGLVQIVQTS